MSYGDLPLDAPLKPNKGHEGGACNRRSCQAEPALYYNHGSHAWYCHDCAIAIGQDHVNKWDWEARWKPECGHDQFETRQQIDARRAATMPEIRKSEHPPIQHFATRPRKHSTKLKRLLRMAKR
jgi:hypothetical protein